VRDAAPALAHLKLAAYALPAAASDVLSTLSGLRSLHLELRSLSSANLDSLVPLAGSLTSLVLYANACLAPKGLQPLAALTRLQQLELAPRVLGRALAMARLSSGSAARGGRLVPLPQ
jgi:hypothetical protein